MTKKKPGQDTFLVQILSTQNSTWQGVITWTEMGRKESFRSTLELIKLIESTLTDSSSDPE